jgi:hypothetical protein
MLHDDATSSLIADATRHLPCAAPIPSVVPEVDGVCAMLEQQPRVFAMLEQQPRVFACWHVGCQRGYGSVLWLHDALQVWQVALLYESSQVWQVMD